MADPFLAEIRIYPFNFPPRGWAWCNGQLMSIPQNTAMFSLLGTTYGGNGKSNFALPDLQGRAPMHPGRGPGLSEHDLGESGGSDTVTLLESELPSHSHVVNASEGDGVERSPVGQQLATGISISQYQQPGQTTAMAPTIAVTGGNQPHNNLQPYLALMFCIALQGIFPQRW